MQNFYRSGSLTDTGKERELNEDAFGALEADWGSLFVVCDGVGGQYGGDVASKLSVETIINTFLEAGIDFDEKRVLTESFFRANNALIDYASTHNGFACMSSTAVALVLKNNRAFIGAIGDSRIYLIRDDKVYQITKDHSFVQNLVDAKQISPNEAAVHPLKNLITKALGSVNILQPDLIGPISLYQNDKFLLCSDGLSNKTSESDLLSILSMNGPQTACNTLVNLANDRGGDDNITVEIIEIIEAPPLPKGKKSIPEPILEIIENNSGNTNKFIVIAVVLIVSLLLFYRFFFNQYFNLP